MLPGYCGGAIGLIEFVRTRGCYWAIMVNSRFSCLLGRLCRLLEDRGLLNRSWMFMSRLLLFMGPMHNLSKLMLNHDLRLLRLTRRIRLLITITV